MVGEGCKMMRIVWVCCALVISQLPATVGAQSTKESAKLLFKSGNENFNAKRYAKALDAFKRANALSPHPVMLKYIGNVYRAMWNYTRRSSITAATSIRVRRMRTKFMSRRSTPG